MEKHAIIGGGNIGTLMAAELAAKEKDVYVYASDAKTWSNNLIILNPDDTIVADNCPIHPTSNLQEAVEGSDYIWITYPTYLLEKTACDLLPYVIGQKIGAIPGACAEFFFGELVAKGCTLFGLQRVHSVARIKERGKSVYMLGRKPSIAVASIPSKACPEIAQEVESFFDMPAVALPSYLALTLVPSNPILHTSRIASMFHDWVPGKTYPRNYQFYEEWTDEASRLMLKCDAELQKICHELPFDLSSVKPLSVHYESYTVSSMTEKISHIPAFKGLLSPMKETSQGQWEPDFQSRYFHADFAYGLEAIHQIATLAGISTPSICSVLDWYYRTSGHQSRFSIPCADYKSLLNIYR